MQERDCQLTLLKQMEGRIRVADFLHHIIKRISHAFMRRKRYVAKWYNIRIRRYEFDNVDTKFNKHNGALKPGDTVRIRSFNEIDATLDEWNRLHGCTFMQEMEQFCGTEQKVLKRVEKFLDECDYRMKKARKTVILKDVFCDGISEFQGCDRACFFFWREEWLKKINNDRN